MSGTWGIVDGRDHGRANDIAQGIYIDYLKSLGLLETVQVYLKQLEAKPDIVRRFIAFFGR